MSQSNPHVSSQADVFAYTELEAASIATLARGSREFLHAAHPGIRSRDLERLSKRSVALELHGCTLAEYYRLKRIPRGLRVHLHPTLFSENVEFCKKFEGILNKCSLDIITLTIEYIQKELVTVAEQVHNIETQLNQLGTPEEFQVIKAQIEQTVKQFRQDTEERKRSKFLRDADDYVSGRVYQWIPGHPSSTSTFFRKQRAQPFAPRGMREAHLPRWQDNAQSGSKDSSPQRVTDSSRSSFLEDSAPSSSGEREGPAEEVGATAAGRTRPIRTGNKTAYKQHNR
ncbi:hypothetical protein XELAEV_18029736mg [Xenopus laevis]|uniref:Uncharacterized protein n=1 Tax=Xenopus laevis TaxID=8355 RepID=A0A974HI11_XENLA|nr:hypothetical protein XELAEV_18029736mg [Xenopus laevis]